MMKYVAVLLVLLSHHGVGAGSPGAASAEQAETVATVRAYLDTLEEVEGRGRSDLVLCLWVGCS